MQTAISSTAIPTAPGYEQFARLVNTRTRIMEAIDFLENKINPVVAQRDSAAEGIQPASMSPIESELDYLNMAVVRINRLADSVVL